MKFLRFIRNCDLFKWESEQVREVTNGLVKLTLRRSDYFTWFPAEELIKHGYAEWAKKPNIEYL